MEVAIFKIIEAHRGEIQKIGGQGEGWGQRNGHRLLQKWEEENFRNKKRRRAKFGGRRAGKGKEEASE